MQCLIFKLNYNQVVPKKKQKLELGKKEEAVRKGARLCFQINSMGPAYLWKVWNVSSVDSHLLLRRNRKSNYSRVSAAAPRNIIHAGSWCL